MIRAGIPIGPALAISLGIVVACPVFGQSLNLASDTDGGPIEIFADDGIEWQRGNEVLIARGNARAVRKDISVTADVLRAHYASRSDGATELSRLDAAGGVKIASPSEKVTGDSAVYNLEKALLVVYGDRVRLDAGNDQITANKQMEYWERRQMAVARGRAVGLHDGKRIRADVLVAFLRPDRQGKSRVFRVQAFDNVVIQTEIDTVRANKGVYNVDSGIATLTGNVRITRGENQFAGDRAEVDLNTGISKLLSAPGEPVRGLLVPRK
ncbi:MAG: hypothetical protein OXH94_08045 [Rhodospirillales bacterium]|nr:hypothetical protein [Rhodospirillales bacterium]